MRASVAVRVCTCASLLLSCGADAGSHKLEKLFPDTNLDFPKYGNELRDDAGSFVKSFDQMFPVRVECWCERYATGLYNSKCQDLVRKEYKWYYAHGVSTMRPDDVWLADAKHYWVKEEGCEYTHPWDQAGQREVWSQAGNDINTFDEKPSHIFFCKDTTHQCKWDLHWAMEDPAYKLGLIGYQCRRCPLYLAVEKKKEQLGEAKMSFDELSLPTRAGWTPFHGWISS
jgi:hypothetical protein